MRMVSQPKLKISDIAEDAIKKYIREQAEELVNLIISSQRDNLITYWHKQISASVRENIKQRGAGNCTGSQRVGVPS